MKTAKITLSILAALVLAPCANAATQISANAGEVREIKWATGTTLYAATQGGGVFKSTDSGANWSVTGLNTGYAWRLAVSPLNSSRIYAATDDGLFRTDNAGSNWTRLTFNPLRAVAVDPGSAGNDTVLIGVPGQGIFRSTDNGVGFARASGVSSTDVTQIIFQTAGTAYAALDCNYQDLIGSFGDGGWGGVSISTNSGQSWTSFNNGGGGGGTSIGTPPNCVRAIAANSSTVFAGTYNPFGASGGVYRSTGGGWTAPGGDFTSGNVVGVESLAIDRNNSNNVWVGSRQIGSFRSTNNGVFWTQMVDPNDANDRPAYTRTYAIETIPGAGTSVLAAAKGTGIRLSTNLGTDWTIAAGLRADRVRGLANHASAASGTYWMAIDNGGVKKSTNSGASWSSVFAGWDCVGCDVNSDARALAADPSNTGQGGVLVGIRGEGFWTSNAAGTGWNISGIPATMNYNTAIAVDSKPQHILMPASNTIYATFFDATSSSAGGLVRSGSGVSGLTQTVYPGSITTCATPASASGSAYKVVQASAGVAYLLRYDDVPYRSTNNFTASDAGCLNAPHVGFSRLAFFDLTEKPGNTSTLVGATNKGVYRSTNAGVNWTRVSITGPAGMPQVLSSMAYVGSNVFAVSRAGGVYCSANDGTTWQAVTTGLPAVPMREIRVISGAIHILTDGGGVYNGFAATCP